MFWVLRFGRGCPALIGDDPKYRIRGCDVDRIFQSPWASRSALSERTIFTTRPSPGGIPPTLSIICPSQRAKGHVCSSPSRFVETRAGVRPVTRRHIGSTAATRLASAGSGQRPDLGTRKPTSISASAVTPGRQASGDNDDTATTSGRVFVMWCQLDLLS